MAGKKNIHDNDYVTAPESTVQAVITGERISVNKLFMLVPLAYRPDIGDCDLFIRCPATVTLTNSDAIWCSCATIYQARRNMILLEYAPPGTYVVRIADESSSSA